MTTNEQLEDQTPNSKRGYFSRHWHGELSLAKSYWVNFWFLSFALTFVLVFWMTLSISEGPVFYSRTTLNSRHLSYYLPLANNRPMAQCNKHN